MRERDIDLFLFRRHLVDELGNVWIRADLVSDDPDVQGDVQTTDRRLHELGRSSVFYLTTFTVYTIFILP